MTSEAEIAWAAGLFEGEGCFYEIRQGRMVYLGLTIEMSDQEIIERFYSILVRSGASGRSKITTRWRGNVNHSRVFAVKMSGTSAERAFALLRPYLGTRRCTRASEILARRAAAMAEATVTRTCVGCATSFTTTRSDRTWCSLACHHRTIARTPEGRAAANERRRRYRQRLRDGLIVR